VRIVDELAFYAARAVSVDDLATVESKLCAYIGLFPSYSDCWQADADRVRRVLDARLEQLAAAEVQS
jgi:hypothetical protein